MRDIATFRSDLFNLTEPRDYFLNPGCFGDDLAKWLIGKLRAKGIEADAEPGQEDFGWYLRYVVNGTPCCAVIGNEEAERWFVTIERQCGLIMSTLGQRHAKIPPAAIEVVHAILREEPRVEDLQWFHWRQFRKGRLLNDGSRTPAD